VSLLSVRGHPDENALASGYTPQQGQQRHPDLLGLISQAGDQCLLIKDLTTLFSLRDMKGEEDPRRAPIDL
jgi:hypothetical protein